MQGSQQIVQRVAFIGFGEAGGILAHDLAGQGCQVCAYDILVNDPVARATLQSKANASGVRLCASSADAIANAQLIVSAVTASAATDVAQEVSRKIAPNQWFLDINSVSPDAKRANAQLIDGAGGRYVEAAVMAPVPPQRLKVPMLLGGARAQELATALSTRGMNAKAVSDKIGVASAIKMCRSVMIKGLEALTLECLSAARHYHAEDAVLASLHASFPDMGWDRDLPNYLISRIAEHGRRRAAEMREVAATVQAAGVPPLMSNATAQRHDALIDAMQVAGLTYSSVNFDWRALADRLAS